MPPRCSPIGYYKDFMLMQESEFDDKVFPSLRVEADDNSFTQQPAASKKAQVRFSRYNEVASIPNRAGISSEERDARWMSVQDYEDMLLEKELTEAVMNCADKRHLVDDEFLCARGLSDSDSFNARQESNMFVQKLILNQMAHQLREGIVDLAQTARIYHDCSLPAVVHAQKIALEDSKDAKKYLYS